MAARPLDTGAMLKEAGITALVIFALAAALVGFETTDVRGGIDIGTRFGDVAVVVAFGFVGRIGAALQHLLLGAASR